MVEQNASSHLEQGKEYQIKNLVNVDTVLFLDNWVHLLHPICMPPFKCARIFVAVPSFSSPFCLNKPGNIFRQYFSQKKKCWYTSDRYCWWSERVDIDVTLPKFKWRKVSVCPCVCFRQNCILYIHSCLCLKCLSTNFSLKFSDDADVLLRRPQLKPLHLHNSPALSRFVFLKNFPFKTFNQ